jgi:hypothetical protein
MVTSPVSRVPVSSVANATHKSACVLNPGVETPGYHLNPGVKTPGYHRATATRWNVLNPGVETPSYHLNPGVETPGYHLNPGVETPGYHLNPGVETPGYHQATATRRKEVSGGSRSAAAHHAHPPA